MGLFTRKSNTVVDVEQDLFLAFQRTYGSGLGAGDPLTNSDVFAAMRILTQAFKQQNLEFTKAYLNPLLKRPNSYQNIDSFWDEVLFSLLLHGNSFVYNDVELKEFRVLEYSKVSVVVKESNSIRTVAYSYKSENGNLITMKSDRVLHFKLYADGGVLGRSPLASLQAELVSNRRGLAAIRSYFSRSTFSNGLLKIKEGKLSDSQKEAIKASLNESLGSQDGSGTLVLDATMDFQVLPVDTSVFKLLEFNKYSSEQVRKVYGIPSHLFGAELVNSKDEVVDKQFKDTAIAPLLKAINSELEFKLAVSLLEPQASPIEETEQVETEVAADVN